MAYKDILVVLDDAAECGARVDVALRLAQRHEAHLIGLMVIESAHIPTYALSQFPPEVMVAWDASREAARAVAGALPVLQAAESVVTLSANPGSGARPDRHGDLPGADIARHLARHGVNVEVHRIETRDVSVADMLLNRIADESIDLLVMGAYGHARVREIWLGGVTRDVLRHMTVPVLVSH